MNYIAAFLSSLCFVSAKAFQQLNVQHDRYRWILPCSLVMGLMEVCGIWLVVKTSFWVFIPLGLGGATGCVLAMVVHKRMRRVSDRRKNQGSVDVSGGIDGISEIEGDLCHEWR